MKKIILLTFLLGLTHACLAQQPSNYLILHVGIFNPDSYYPKPKAPALPPYVEQEGYTLTFGSHADYTLCLLDENENVVYTTYIPDSVSSVALPSYLSGTFEIRLLTDSVYFYGYITL